MRSHIVAGIAGAAAVLAFGLAPARAAPFMIVGNDEKILWDDAGKPVLSLPGKDSVLIVASSDMNHYESDAVTRVKDHRAIERILTLDPRGLFDVVSQQNISMCGFGPAVAMLTAARRLGARLAELVKYATSGDVSGDRETVVGYAGVVIS